MKSARLLPALAALLAAPALAQPAPPPGGPALRDPFGSATVTRAEAQAQSEARFAALDANRDGALSEAELLAARPGRAPAGGPPRGMGRMLDGNGDGRITRDEFVAVMLHRFEMMDTDHDGKLAPAERQAAMAAMRARMAQRMRERLQDGSGMNAGEPGSGD